MTNQYNNNSWNPWTNKSSNVQFKSNVLALGDGEQKLAAEYDTTPLGQNASYDLKVMGEKWEIKKLDSDNSFRLGVEVSTNYRLIIDCVIRILEKLLLLENFLNDSETSDTIKRCISDIKSNSGSSSTKLIEGLRKNEVSSSNLDKANKIIEILKSKCIDDNNMNISLFSSFDGTIKNYNIITAFRKLEFENIAISEKLIKLNCDMDFYTRVQLTSSIIDDISIFNELSLKEKLNEIVRSVFVGIKLVLVHETNGYKPVTDLNLIYCNRITSGNPRCKLF